MPCLGRLSPHQCPPPQSSLFPVLSPMETITVLGSRHRCFALSDFSSLNDCALLLQNEEELDGQEGLDDLRVIQVVDEDGRVTTLKAASFDMASSAEFDDDDEEEEEVMVSALPQLKVECAFVFSQGQLTKFSMLLCLYVL